MFPRLVFSLSIFLLSGLIGLPVAKGQVLDRIVGFEALKDGFTGSYVFHPVCTDADGANPHPCSPGELHPYLFEWKFGEGDYSLQPMPARRFDGDLATGQQVTMRATGIKEERTGPCISDPTCTATYYTSLSPGKWAVVHEETKDLLLPAMPDPAESVVADQYMTSCFEDARTLAICIGQPWCKPLWSAQMVYPMVFYNPTDCAYELEATLADHVQRWTDKSWVDNLVQCEDFKVDEGLECPAPSTKAVFRFSIPAQSSIVVLTNHQIMKQSEDLDSTKHEVVLEATARPEGPVTNGCDSLTLRATHQDTIVTTIDPNKKWIAGKQPVYHPGEYIRFAIQFKNDGDADETLVYVEDPLDLRLDISKIEFVTGRIVGPDRHEVITARQVTEKTFEGDSSNVYQMMFRAHGFVLGPEDSGTVLFRVPVLAEEGPSLPTWLMVADTSYDTLENRGYTMFSSEGVVYETEPVRFVIAKTSWRFGVWFWVSAGAVAGLLGMVISWIARRGRKR